MTEQEWRTLLEYLDRGGVDHGWQTQDRHLTLSECFFLFDRNGDFKFDKQDNLTPSLFQSVERILKKCSVKVEKEMRRECPRQFEPQKPAAETPLKSCTVLERLKKEVMTLKPGIERAQHEAIIRSVDNWSSVPTANNLIRNGIILGHVAKAIVHIEAHQLGRLDTYGVDPACNFYHFHLLAEKGTWSGRELTIKDKETIEKRDMAAGIAFVYHTEELTERFPDNAAPRNIIQYSDGHLITMAVPRCGAAHGADLDMDLLANFSVALISADSPLYELAQQLPDGRRFIVWIV